MIERSPIRCRSDLKSFVKVEVREDHAKRCVVEVIQCPKTGQLFELRKISKERTEQQLRHIRDIIHLYETVISNSCIQPLLWWYESVAEIQVLLELTSRSTLKELIETRGSLTQFEAKYFAKEIFYTLCYLQQNDVSLWKFTCADLILDEDSMKIQFGFLMDLVKIDTHPHRVTKHCSIPHQKLKNTLSLEAVESRNSINIGHCLYQMLEGKPLNMPVAHSPTAPPIQFNKVKKQSPYRQAIEGLLNCNPHKQLEAKSLFAPGGILHGPIPSVLPRTISLCPPSVEFQNDCSELIIKSAAEAKSSAQAPERAIKLVKKASSGNQLSAAELPATYKQFFSTVYEPADDWIYVQEFCDISRVLGYGYRMSNGLVGFYFNDKTLLIMSSERNIYFFDENWEVRPIKEQKITDSNDIKKKYYILLAYMKSLTKLEKSQTNNRLHYVKQYIRTKNARLFSLSTNSVQAQFLDQTQILSTGSQSLYYDKKQARFRPIKHESEEPQVLLQERYTRQLGRKLLGWAPKGQDYCGTHEEEQDP